MKVDVIISADYIRKDIIKDKVIVVVDVLRATSVITTALMNGCNNVKPFLTVEEAFHMKAELNSENCILGGERDAIKIEGFDLGNSPLEYVEEVVKDKTLIITTTNGTRTLTKCSEAYEILIGCMLNGGSVAERLINQNRDIVIVNAGTNGQFSMDDYICTGFILKEMMNEIGDKSIVELSDIATAALKVYEEHENIIDYIRDARHYKVMMDLGMNNDISYCIQKNITNIVPKYKNGVIM